MEEDEFATRYRAHVDEVWRYARRRTASEGDADDATAEAFAVAWRRRDDLPEPPDLRLWLLGTVRRVLANQHRADRRRANLRGRLDALPLPAPPPDAVEAGEEAARIWRALASLPDDQRDLLIMRAWDGLAVTDIAVLLGCSPNAVSIRLTRARDRLAEALQAKDRVRTRTSGGRDLDREGATDDRS